jgi:dephospho-CoA kinase
VGILERIRVAGAGTHVPRPTLPVSAPPGPDLVTHPAQPPTFVFGVLGGIASGKSLVARLLAGPRGLALEADGMAHAELASAAGRARLVERYGPDVLTASGEPDRRALAERVFASSDERRWLEGWIHPAVGVRMMAELSEARARGVPRVVLDVPLLVESDGGQGLLAACDALVFVDASQEVREQRAGRERGWLPGELARREALQLPLAQKRARADHVIVNDGDRADLARAVERVLALHGLT